MKLEEVQPIAEGMGRTAYEAAVRPAQQGDVLVLQTARDRTPIDLVNWLEGYWNEAPPMGKVVEVVGDYDIIRVDSNTRAPIRREWGKAYLKSAVGAEIVTFATKDAFVLSEHAEPENPEKRVKACLAEAIAVACGFQPNVLPEKPVFKRLFKHTEGLWKALPNETIAVLTGRYRDAPLLLGWPAPEWENDLARTFVRCAVAGGKQAGKHFTGLQDSLVVPAWTTGEG